jgi:hypothetical protein
MTISGADTGSIVISETAGSIGTVTGMFDGSRHAYLDGGGLSFQLATIDTHGSAFVNLS